jgi:hypothetical protein
MSVRKRTWTTSKGEQREAWIVDYSDQQGERHIRTFDRKKEADAFHASVNVDVAAGIHTPLSKSMTVAEAGEAWLRKVEIEGRERSTQDQYRQHVTIHINPRLGREKLARLTTPRIEAFKDDLLASMSRALAKKVLVSLKSILREAQRTGGVAQNVALGVKINSDKRDAPKLRVGVDIPSPDEIKRLLAAADGLYCRIRRIAGIRAARPAMGGRGPEACRAARAAACGLLQRHWQPKVPCRGAHNPAGAVRDERPARVEAGLPQKRGRACIPDRHRPRLVSRQHHPGVGTDHEGCRRGR